VARREPRDDEQADAGFGGQRHDPEVGRILQQRIELLDVLGFDAEPLVLDLDHDTPADHVAADLDAGLGRRVRRGVVDEFGEQVNEVADHRAVDGDGRQLRHLHPGEILGFGRSATRHLRQAHRVTPLPARLPATEDDQVLRIAPCARREVVQLEQGVQLVRVLLLALRLIEHLELAMHDDLAAVRDVEEDGLGAFTCFGLLDGRRDRGLLRLVEGVGHLADLIGTMVEEVHVVVEVDGLSCPHLCHEFGQPDVGHAERVLTQPGEPADEPVGQAQRDEEHRYDNEQCGGARDQRRDKSATGLIDRQSSRMAALLDEDFHQRVADVTGRGPPLVLRHRELGLAAAQ